MKEYTDKVDLKKLDKMLNNELEGIHIYIKYPNRFMDPLDQQMTVGAKWKMRDEDDWASDEAGDYTAFTDHLTPDEAIELAKEILRNNGVME